ncbi:MAG: MBL fold metallo-hydrolase [Acidobacteria bacterium]|nr:MBL fold metallo-hydrolase [Acidobacteriota bacterium]
MTIRQAILALASAIVVGITALPPTLAQEDDFGGVEIKTIRIDDGLHMMTGSGGNLAVSVGGDGAFLVDDQFAPLTEKIQAAISKITDKPVRFVINTHWHHDHVGGNENFGKAGSLIVAHENVRKRMSVEQFLEAFDNRVPASPAGALPVITFTDSVTFHWNDEEIHIFHVENAHTDGDAVVHFKNSNALHTGDLYFNGFYPFIDVSSNGSIEGVIRGADKILKMIDDSTKIVPGHGPLSNKKELKAYRDMLADVRDAVSSLVAAGKTKEEVLAAKPTQPWDAKWGGGFLNPEEFTDIIYTDLSGK